MEQTSILLIDEPRPGVRRLTMNRPEKRNALNNALRGAILSALQEADADPAVKVSILRGAGPCFSAGYDLSANNAVEQPFYSPGGPDSGRATSSRVGSKSGTSANRLSLKCTVTAWPAAAS